MRFRELAQELIRGFFPFAPPEAQATAEGALREMAAWVRQMAAERRRTLGEDLISDLIRTQERDETLTDDEIVMLISVLIGAGSETTNLGGLVMIQTLLGHPEQLKRVRDDRSLVPKAVNEIMRFAFGGPAGLPRFAVRDFELRGKQIRKGQMLMLSFGGANRDPGRVRRPRHARHRARRARPARVRQRPALLPRGEPRAPGDGRDARRGARHRHAGLAGARRPASSSSRWACSSDR